MLELAHLVALEADAVEHDVAAAVGDAARDGLGEHAGLLVDLLGHEVAMAFLAHGQALAIHLVAGPLHVMPLEIAQGHPRGLDDADVAVLEIAHRLRVGLDGEDVGGEEELFLAIADDERARPTGAENHARMAGRDETESKAALEAPEGRTERLHEAKPSRHPRGHEVGHDLGVGGRGEVIAGGLELVAQLQIILDDAVVHDGDTSARVRMRMGIGLGGGAMGGPAGMPDAHVRLQGLLEHLALQIDDLADLATELETAVEGNGETRGVIAAVLQALETVHHHDLGEVVPDVADDAAHDLARISSSGRRPGVPRPVYLSHGIGDIPGGGCPDFHEPSDTLDPWREP
jgi:hypothetical protein